MFPCVNVSQFLDPREPCIWTLTWHRSLPFQKLAGIFVVKISQVLFQCILLGKHVLRVCLHGKPGPQFSSSPGWNSACNQALAPKSKERTAFPGLNRKFVLITNDVIGRTCDIKSDIKSGARTTTWAKIRQRCDNGTRTIFLETFPKIIRYNIFSLQHVIWAF